MMNLYHIDGKRKYITDLERKVFLASAAKFSREVRSFCMVLAYTGCRISEALALTVDKIDIANQSIIFESLKKRKRGVFRSVPIPENLIETLDLIHGIREAQKDLKKASGMKLWNWSRMTAYRRIKAVMDDANIQGPQATPKGLRHGLGVTAVKKAPLNMAQKWLGHAQITTTAIYADAIGEEERELASRMWE